MVDRPRQRPRFWAQVRAATGAAVPAGGAANPASKGAVSIIQRQSLDSEAVDEADQFLLRQEIDGGVGRLLDTRSVALAELEDRPRRRIINGEDVLRPTVNFRSVLHSFYYSHDPTQQTGATPPAHETCIDRNGPGNKLQRTDGLTISNQARCQSHMVTGRSTKEMSVATQTGGAPDNRKQDAARPNAYRQVSHAVVNWCIRFIGLALHREPDAQQCKSPALPHASRRQNQSTGKTNPMIPSQV